MKKYLQILIALSALLLGTANAESKYTKDQVIALGRVVLAADVNKEYKPYFWDSQPLYDDKAQIWRFTPTIFPVTPDGTVYFFEIRESDGFYRLGWIAGIGSKASSGSDKFRIQSSVRGKLTDLLKAYEKP